MMLAGLDAALDPDLVDFVALPVGEEADAVTGAHDGFKIVLEFVHGQVTVDDLGHIEARLHVESHFCDDAERAERDDGAEETIAVGIAGDLDDFSIGVDEFEGSNGCREVAVFYA